MCILYILFFQIRTLKLSRKKILVFPHLLKSYPIPFFEEVRKSTLPILSQKHGIFQWSVFDGKFPSSLRFSFHSV